MDKTPATIVGDAITAASTHDDKRKVALGLLAYSIGALAALDGPKIAAEYAYRHADAAVRVKR